MIFLLGFRTPNSDEVPEILYVGNDGDALNRIAEAAKHPRVAKMVNPPLYPIRHWSEEAAAAFAILPITTTPSGGPAAESSAESADENPPAPEPAPVQEVEEEATAQSDEDGPSLLPKGKKK